MLLAFDDCQQHSRAVQVHPGLTSWGILSRPCGTGSRWECTPSTNVLGYSQPSLRDWTRFPLIAGFFSGSAVQISRSRKLIWTSLTLSRPYGTQFGELSSHADSEALVRSNTLRHG